MVSPFVFRFFQYSNCCITRSRKESSPSPSLIVVALSDRWDPDTSVLLAFVTTFKTITAFSEADDDTDGLFYQYKQRPQWDELYSSSSTWMKRSFGLQLTGLLSPAVHGRGGNAGSNRQRPSDHASQAVFTITCLKIRNNTSNRARDVRERAQAKIQIKNTSSIGCCWIRI